MEDNKKNEPMATEPLNDEAMDPEALEDAELGDVAGGALPASTFATCKRCHKTLCCKSAEAAKNFVYCASCWSEMVWSSYGWG